MKMYSISNSTLSQINSALSTGQSVDNMFSNSDSFNMFSMKTKKNKNLNWREEKNQKKNKKELRKH